MKSTPPCRRPHQASLALALSVALLVSPSAPAQPAGTGPTPLRLPSLGESASDDFNLSAEKRLGEQIMREIRRDPDFIDDPLVNDYLQSIWQPIVKAARERGDIGADVAVLFPFEAFLVRDRTVNAFALPGGYVGVHLGLIAMTATRDELASVMAHEFSHISQRHIARSIASNARNSTLGVAAMILGVLAASRSRNADVANAAIVGGQAAMVQNQLNFSRDMEREADRNGQSLMVQAGFMAGGMNAMFAKLDQANRLNDNGAFPYLRSHPLTVERIAEAQQRAAQLGAAGQAATPAETTRWHALMQARARVLMDPSVDSIRRLQDLDGRAGNTEERLAGYYASALASVLLRDFARADRALQAAQALPGVREDGFTQHALAPLATQLALAKGDWPAATAAVAGVGDEARSRPAMLLRAQVALASGDPAAIRHSTEVLQTWVSEHKLDALSWQSLSHCAEAQGQPLRALRAAAEAQAAIGNIQGAMDRLRAGQQMARRGAVGNDFIEASVIDSRWRELQAQRRELMAGQRSSRGSSGPDDERP
ncbi:MAG: M48 family metalloprotease [Ideonella sp.]|nr:M48 family metalloprotease [Ideonella sp.]